MPRRSANFTQADVARALKGAEAAGFKVGEVRIDKDGTIHLLPKPPEAPKNDKQSPEPW